MIRYLILIFIFLYTFSFYGLTEYNDFYDMGLNPKDGVFNFNRYMNRQSYFVGFGSVGNDEFSEAGAMLSLYSNFGNLKGFYIRGGMTISQLNTRSTSGDLDEWWGGNVPFFDETYIGFQNKYFMAQLGWQNIVSSDAIYNHLMIDDYSGEFLSYKSQLMPAEFIDFEVSYNIVRWHQGPWYNGDEVKEPIFVAKSSSDQSHYQALYGKSLYFHKINIRPAPWFRIGVFESVYFLGENINPYYITPFVVYFGVGIVDQLINQKYGSRQNTQGTSIKIGLDFNIGFDGWRFYGEMMIDDANGEYFKFMQPDHPDRVAFLLGGELRGSLFTKYFRVPKIADIILSNLYINAEYGIVSKYTYSRDSNYNYEYVRDEYAYSYWPEEYKENNDPDYVKYISEFPDADYSLAESSRVNRVGNFLGFMYGSNSDSLDIAIGWRNDLVNVRDYSAGYRADVYYDSLENKSYPERLVKFQIHYRRYRLGDDRDVVMPFYMNEHFFYDLNIYVDSDGDGDFENDKSDRRTEFLSNVVKTGDNLNLSFYTDIIKISRFVLGFETQGSFEWSTYFPNNPDKSYTDFQFKLDFGAIISW